jgi:pyrophosphatase PpaX
MTRAPFRAWLFDLDGTLIDSIELIWRSYCHAVREHFGREATRDEWKPGLGRPLRWQFGQLTSDVAEVETLIHIYREFNNDWHDRLVTPYAGVRELLSDLRRDGAKIAIVTSKLQRGAQRGLAHCNLTEFVDVIVGADDVERPKPDPAPMQRALDLLGVAANESIVVGDSPHDIRSGLDAGCYTCGALWGGFERADFGIDVPHRFAAAVRELR